MRRDKLLIASALISLLGLPLASQAYEGDWKRGHVYYRMVCTDCHKQQAGGPIGPNTRTRAEWTAYLQADRHARGKDSARSYVGWAYRDSVKASNRAAAKFIDVPEQELYEDLRAFLMRSAKDGDAPTGCR